MFWSHQAQPPATGSCALCTRARGVLTPQGQVQKSKYFSSCSICWRLPSLPAAQLLSAELLSPFTFHGALCTPETLKCHKKAFLLSLIVHKALHAFCAEQLPAVRLEKQVRSSGNTHTLPLGEEALLSGGRGWRAGRRGKGCDLPATS